jgi:hypothetical protein
MHYFRASRRLHVWIGIMAMLVSVVMPSVSRMLTARQASSAWVDVCSLVAGPHALAAPQGDSHDDGPADAGGHPANCLYCKLSAHSPGLPATPPSSLAEPPAAREDPSSLSYKSPSSQFAWITPSPRAPPRRA